MKWKLKRIFICVNSEQNAIIKMISCYIGMLASKRERHGGFIRPRMRKRSKSSYREKRPKTLNLKNLQPDYSMLPTPSSWGGSGIANFLPYRNGREDEGPIVIFVCNGYYRKKWHDVHSCPFDMLTNEQLDSVILISNLFRSA